MNSKKGIYLVFVLAFILRVVGIGFGLPFIYHQDEPIIVNHAMSIGVGGWNTHFFIIPPFTINLLFVVEGILFCLGKMMNLFQSTSDFGLLFIKDPSLFYWWGRFFIGCVPGTLTVGVSWFAGRHFFNEKIAFWAAFFLAIIPMHVQHSHYIYADILLTLATTLMFFALLKILETPSLKNYLIFGFLCGWGTSIKYTALYFTPILVVAHLIAYQKESFESQNILKLILSGCSCIFVYCVLAPYTFLDWPNFHEQILGQAEAERLTGCFHHALYSIAGGSGILFMFFSLAGLFFIFYSSKAKSIITLSFILIYYFINIFFGQPFARYMMPLIPIFAFLAASGLEGFQDSFGNKKWLRVLTAVMCLELFLPVFYGDALFLNKDTRTECVEWFNHNVEQGGVVVVDNRFFGPHLPDSPEQIRKKYDYLADSDQDLIRKKRLDYFIKGSLARKTYNVYQLVLDEKQKNSPFLFSRPYVGASQRDLEKIGAQYMVVNYSDSSTNVKMLLKTLDGRVQLVKSFSPYWDMSKKDVSDPEASTAAPHLVRDLFSRKSLGPYLEVYRFKNG